MTTNQIFEFFIILHKNNLNIHNNITMEAFKDEGNKRLAANDVDGAIESYTKAIALDGNNHILYSNRAAAYLKKNANEEALVDAKKCVEINPSFSKGYSRLGGAYFALGQMEDAGIFKFYRKLLKITKN